MTTKLGCHQIDFQYDTTFQDTGLQAHFNVDMIRIRLKLLFFPLKQNGNEQTPALADQG